MGLNNTQLYKCVEDVPVIAGHKEFVYRSKALHFLIFLISFVVCISPEAASLPLCHCLRVAPMQPVDRRKMLSVAIMAQRLLFFTVVISFLFSCAILSFSLPPPHCPPLLLCSSLLIFLLHTFFSGVNRAVF